MFEGNRHGRIGFIGLFTGEHFEEDDTHGINIGAAIHAGALGLFGRHVCRCADDGAAGHVAGLGLR